MPIEISETYTGFENGCAFCTHKVSCIKSGQFKPRHIISGISYDKIKTIDFLNKTFNREPFSFPKSEIGKIERCGNKCASCHKHNSCVLYDSNCLVSAEGKIENNTIPFMINMPPLCSKEISFLMQSQQTKWQNFLLNTYKECTIRSLKDQDGMNLDTFAKRYKVWTARFAKNETERNELDALGEAICRHIKNTLNPMIELSRKK